MKMVSLFSLMIAVSGLIACTRGGGGNPPPEGNRPQPRTKEEALNQLPPELRAHFEAWQSKVLKSCDPENALGLNQSGFADPNGVDGAALIKINNNSVVFKDESHLTFITEMSEMSGESTSKVEQTTESNGAVQTINVETKRVGSLCTVFLYGQKVFETHLFESVKLGMQWSANKPATIKTIKFPLVKLMGSHGAAEVQRHGAYSLIQEFFRPNQDFLFLIRQKLGLTDNELSQYFRNSAGFYGDYTVKLQNDSAAEWSYPGDGNLIGSLGTLQQIFELAEGNLDLDVLVSLPHFDIDGTVNNADLANLKISLNSKLKKSENLIEYSLLNSGNWTSVAYDDAEAEKCLRGRLNAYLGENLGVFVVSPPATVLFNACKIIDPGVESKTLKNGVLKSFIPMVFANYEPKIYSQYGGWESILKKFAIDVLANNKDLINELDPEGKTYIIPLLAHHLNGIKMDIEKSTNLKNIADSAYQMGLDWTLMGYNVDRTLSSRILQSADNTADVFKVSTEKFLADRSVNPYSHEDQMDFAMALTTDYKRIAVEALNQANELDYKDFKTNVFDVVIQEKTSIDELKQWVANFSLIKNELQKYPGVSSVKKEMAPLSLKLLLNRRISPAELDDLYSALNNAIDPFVESTKALIEDLGENWISNQAALEFARKLTPEYKQLAVNIRNNSKSAKYESWGDNFFKKILQNQPSLEQLKTWNETWSAIIAFIQRENARINGDSSFYPEQNRKKLMDRALDETWTNTNFSEVEGLAALGVYKNTCEHYKDVSSLVDCVGMNLFSKQPKKLLDSTFAGRYPRLGVDFKEYLRQLIERHETILSWDFINSFFGYNEPIWSRCEQNQFNQKSSTLKSQFDVWLSTTDQIKRWDVERQIKETLGNCR